MVMSMEYFKKIQCYKPSIGIIDAPVNIEEVALLQDSVDKNILGRIKFINYSKQSIIAIFVQLRVANIAGEPIALDKERFIYQDMKVSPGELYGNRIPISLPADARYFSVQLEKVVFDNGEIWNATNGTSCKVSQKEIQVPEEVIDSVREELKKHLNNVEYVHYFYEEEQNFWGCTCGKINSDATRMCTFCGNFQNSQKYYLTEENVNRLVIEKQKEIEDEKQKKLLIEAEKKRIEAEKNRKIQQERLEKWEQLRKEQEKIEKNREIVAKKKKKICRCIIGIAVVALISLGVASYNYTKKKTIETYQRATEAYQKEDYETAIKEWNKILSYEDSEYMINDATEKRVYQSIDNCIKEHQFDEAREIIESNFDTDTDIEARDKKIEVSYAEIKYRDKKIRKYFKNTKAKDTKMISKVLACTGKSSLYMENYTGINLDDWYHYAFGKYSTTFCYEKEGTFGGVDGKYEIDFVKADNGITTVIEEINFVFENYYTLEGTYAQKEASCLAVVEDVLGRKYNSATDGNYYTWNYDMMKVDFMNFDVPTVSFEFNTGE